MFIELKFILLMAIVLIFLTILYFRTLKSIFQLKFQKRSLSSRYGKAVENFMPFLQDFPYNPENFRFLGNPIDGISFEEDKIVFMEFKTASSKLSDKQKNIKELVEDKKVDFQEIRID